MIEFGVMRGYVGELWRKGELTSCGYISDRTKVVFRSSSAIYHIFIQMSREMWNFDEFGDLFFEKSVKFLRELILKSWVVNFFHASNTILIRILFALTMSPWSLPHGFLLTPRVLISQETVSFRETPMVKFMQISISKSFCTFISIFLRVMLQTERNSHEEWKRNFSQLMLAFKRYQSDIRYFVLKYLPEVKDSSQVSIRLSAARETNLLESLNLILSGQSTITLSHRFFF